MILGCCCILFYVGFHYGEKQLTAFFSDGLLCCQVFGGKQSEKE